MTSASGTRYVTGTSPRIIVGQPSLFYTVGVQQLVYITWGADVRVYVINASEIRGQIVLQLKVRSVSPGPHRVSIDLGAEGIMLVPRPRQDGGGTWQRKTPRTLHPLKTADYEITRHRVTGAPTSIVPKS